MPISDIEEQTLDLDWFAVDRDGFIANFATGGSGAMPDFISSRLSIEDLNRQLRMIRNLPPTTRPLVNPTLGQHVTFETEAQQSQFMKSYVETSARGLFAYNCMLARTRPQGYYLVAAPERPITLSECSEGLHSELKNLTFREWTFASQDSFDGHSVVSAVPNAIEL